MIEEPATASTSTLALRLLGYPDLALHGAPLGKPLTSKTLALLAYLAMESQRDHGRAELASLFWPESSRTDGRQSLRQALYVLRQALPTTPPILLISRQSVGFNIAAGSWLDVDACRALLATCQDHAHRRLDACPLCMERREEAMVLYHGDFMAGFHLPNNDPFQAWQLAQQEALRGHMLTALADLAAYRARGQEYDQAIAFLHRILEMAPWQEETHRHLMRVLALDGQRNAALNQYEACRSLLAAEMDIDPDAGTTALYEQIKAGLLEPELVEVSNPYRGLSAFEEKDVADFYGRELIGQRLLAAVQQLPLVALIGTSGSGKSSLLYAGLLPRLAALTSIPASHASQNGHGEGVPWVVVDFQPGRDPFQSLAEAAAPLMSPVQDHVSLAGALRAGKQSLADLAAVLLSAPDRPPGRLLIIIDKFEELYTLCPDPETRCAFLDLLLFVCTDQSVASPDHSTALIESDSSSPQSPLTNPQPSITVLIALRTDLATRALSYRPLADAIQKGEVLVQPMNETELRRSVEKAAISCGVRFEPGLVERLLADVGSDPGNLALLQLCLTQLWSHQAAGTLIHIAYEDMGGLAGTLSHYADRVYSRLSPGAQDVAQQIFMRLVRPGETTGGTRRWASREELGETNWPLVQQLADDRLVVIDCTANNQEQAALVHDALIKHWDRLRVWLEKGQAFHLWQHRLWPLLREWESCGRDAAALLRGALLAQAEEWAAQPATNLNELEHAFIEASIAQRQKELTDEEKHARHEVALRQSLAEMGQKCLETEAKANRHKHWLMVSLAINMVLVLLVATALG